MATAISPLSNEELANELAVFVDKAIGGETSKVTEETKSSLSKGQVVPALKNILANADLLWKSSTEKDLEGFYALFGSFLVETENLETVLRDQLIASITSQTDRPLTRLAILNNLFNSCLRGAWRIAFIEAILRFSLASKQNQILDSILPDLDKLFQRWNVTDSEKQKIHHLLYQLLAESDPWVSHVHMIRWLEAFKNEKDCEQLSSELSAAIIDSISRNDVFQYQAIFNSVPVAYLTSKMPAVVQLLKILVNGTFSDFEAFAASNKDLFKAPLSLEALQTKMRILTVVSMASQRSNIPYADLAAALKVDENDVENWVMDAVAEGLLEAKLDQLTSSVFVTFALQREFGVEQWKQLGEKVDKWKENLENMLNIIRQARTHGKDGQHKALQQALVAGSQ